MLKKDCFKCGKELESIFPDKFQAYAGTQFISYGHYGSTLFDPMNENEYIEIVICDKCLSENANNVSHTKKSSEYTGKNYTDINGSDENIEILESVSTTITNKISKTWEP